MFKQQLKDIVQDHFEAPKDVALARTDKSEGINGTYSVTGKALYATFRDPLICTVSVMVFMAPNTKLTTV